MDLDVTQAASAAMPYVVAAVQAYGLGTLGRLRDTAIDHAADASAAWGRKLLVRLYGEGTPQPELESAVAALAADPDAEDAATALRQSILAALQQDAELNADIITLLTEAHRDSSDQHFGNGHHLVQNAASFGNSKQVVLGSGVQNVTFGK